MKKPNIHLFTVEKIGGGITRVHSSLGVSNFLIATLGLSLSAGIWALIKGWGADNSSLTNIGQAFLVTSIIPGIVLTLLKSFHEFDAEKDSFSRCYYILGWTSRTRITSMKKILALTIQTATEIPYEGKESRALHLKYYPIVLTRGGKIVRLGQSFIVEDMEAAEGQTRELAKSLGLQHYKPKTDSHFRVEPATSEQGARLTTVPGAELVARRDYKLFIFCAAAGFLFFLMMILS